MSTMIRLRETESLLADPAYNLLRQDSLEPGVFRLGDSSWAHVVMPMFVQW